MTPDEEVAEYQKRTGIHLDAHSRSTLKSMIERDNKFWDKEPFREDNHTSPEEGM